jgi:cytochrome c2
MTDPLSGAPPAIAATQLGRSGCLQCHANPAAPQLTRILGADIASQPGIDYSPALAAVAGHWDRARLAAFLTDPQAFAPGTPMERSNLSTAELDALLDELAQS